MRKNYISCVRRRGIIGQQMAKFHQFCPKSGNLFNNKLSDRLKNDRFPKRFFGNSLAKILNKSSVNQVDSAVVYFNYLLDN